jgi:hypothetical protein
VILGTKCPSITSTWIHELPKLIRSEHSFPRAEKSADRIEGAMIAGGDIANTGKEKALFRAGDVNPLLSQCFTKRTVGTFYIIAGHSTFTAAGEVTWGAEAAAKLRALLKPTSSFLNHSHIFSLTSHCKSPVAFF